MKLKIANIELPGKVILSPMAGVTDAPFREIARQNGADYTISEMLTSQTQLWSTQKTRLRLEDKWNTGLKILQIGGAKPNIVTEAAIRCQEIGADIVEINMGCPAKKVCNVLAGSALLRDEKLVATILAKVAKIASIPVTLKTRLGWDHEHKNILQVARIAEVKNQVKIPVFANGDINTPEKAKQVLEYTKADGIYVGRATLGRPWLLQQIKDYLATGMYTSKPSLRQIKKVISQHFSYIYEHYPEPLCLRYATKHFKWYCQQLGIENLNTTQIFNQFSNSVNREQQLELVEAL
jgi:tRNA-dihydrouridine synthase B